MTPSNKSTGSSRYLMAVSLAVSATFGATPALAQSGPGAQDSDAADDAQSDEEIVVTARKREETLIEVPDAVTAFNAEQIEQAGLRSLNDFANLTPNVTILRGSAEAYPTIMVRGLALAQGGEPPIAVVIDGVQIAQTAFINQDYGEVAQVEVLRGPQGSLYGRNAIGGAINITTRQPSNEFEGRAELSYGNADTVRGVLDLSGPIVEDRLLFRAGGSYRRTDGQIRNRVTGEPADFGENLFLRGRLLFRASSEFSVDLRANYGHDDIGSTANEVVSRANFEDFRPGFLFGVPGLTDHRTIYDLSAKLEYEGAYLTVTSITGYSEADDRLFGDADFTAAHIVLQEVRLRVSALTQELRIQSPDAGRFRWLIGGFYQDRDTRNFLDIPFDDGTGRPVPGAFAIRSRDIGTSESWAIFGSASYDILPALELTVGARYDEDRRSSVDEFFAGSNARATFSDFQPKIQIAYKPNDDTNLYATYGRGFTSGGFNAFFSGSTRLYEAQTANNYELGFKRSFANGRFRLGAALFQVDYNDQQFFFIGLNPPSQSIVNIDRTRVRGVELEVLVRPTPRLDLSAALGLMDAEIRRFDTAPATVGNTSPQSVPYTLNLCAQYSLPLSEALDLRAYGSFRRQGREFWDAANTLRTGAKDFLNFRLFVESDRFSVGAFVNNLTNTQLPLQAIADVAGPDGNVRIPSLRRTYGIEARVRF